MRELLHAGVVDDADAQVVRAASGVCLAENQGPVGTIVRQRYGLTGADFCTANVELPWLDRWSIKRKCEGQSFRFAGR